jgi:hypothetical protein
MGYDAAMADKLNACGRAEKDFISWWHISQAWKWQGGGE